MIPISRMDPTAAIVQNMVPLPNTPGLVNYTAPGYSNFRHTTIPSVKMDYLSLGTPAYGSPAAILKYSDSFGPSNVYGNPVLTWPNFSTPSIHQPPRPPG
jgi:hypothetical protein